MLFVLLPLYSQPDTVITLHTRRRESQW